MPVTIIETPGASNANSYLSLAEANAYFAERLPLPGWDNADSKAVLLVMATRVIDSMARPLRTLVQAQGNTDAYYLTRPQWTGLPATTTQKLAWPRIGMYDANGNAIPSTVIPQDLKNATAELAGQLGTADRTLDNDVIVQGIKGIRAGSVSVDFKDMIAARVWPDAVWNLLVPSWLTSEVISSVGGEEFDVVSR